MASKSSTAPPPDPPPQAPARPADSKEVLARVNEGMSLVGKVVGQMRRQLGTKMPADDMASYAREALLMSARSYDPARGVPFVRWANLRMRGAIIDGMRAHQLPRRLYERLRALEAADRVKEATDEEDASAQPAGSPGAPRVSAKSPAEADAALRDRLSAMATAMAVSVMAPSAHDDFDQVAGSGRTAEEEVLRKELLGAVRDAIEARPEAERALLVRHYFDGVTFEQAASEIGLSKSWASRLHARAIEGISRDMQRRRLSP